MDLLTVSAILNAHDIPHTFHKYEPAVVVKSPRNTREDVIIYPLDSDKFQCKRSLQNTYRVYDVDQLIRVAQFAFYYGYVPSNFQLAVVDEVRQGGKFAMIFGKPVD